jgi:hypothetical protein
MLRSKPGTREVVITGTDHDTRKALEMNSNSTTKDQIERRKTRKGKVTSGAFPQQQRVVIDLGDKEDDCKLRYTTYHIQGSFLTHISTISPLLTT